MIAYVFWHWKKKDVSTRDYEERQRDFHAALAASSPRGFIRSLSVSVAGLAWAPSGEAYEDWYLVEDFAALGSLNDGAISASRRRPHDAAAALSEDGAGGIYALRHGEALLHPRYALWFAKPAGMSYGECFAQLAPVTDRARGALWIRQMVLGPARELCLQAETEVSLPPGFDALRVRLRQVFSPSLA